MAATKTLSENTVNYKLFCLKSDRNDKSKHREECEILAETYLSKISGFLHRYIWQNDHFNFHVVESNVTGFPSYLEGITNYDDNVEDEWFIVFLLFYLSDKDKNLVIQINDNDGEFLLIEAANHLPKWLNPDTSENRVFIHQGALHIIPVAKGPGDVTPLPSGTPSLKDAVNVVHHYSSLTRAAEPIQEAIRNRNKEFPHKIDEMKHRTHCYLPYAVASILKEDPHLLPHAVRAFYLRDPIDLKACRAMKFFAPETRVMAEVTFTRCLYAQLSSQKYEPDKRTGWNMPAETSPHRRAHELGMKLACGFEILASNVEQRMQVEQENREHDFCNDVRWRRFAKSLKERGYFRDEVEGTQLYNRLLLQAKDFYLTSLTCDPNGNVRPGIRIRKLLSSLNANYEEMKEEEKSLAPPDDDSWMTITPDMLDSMLSQMSHSHREEDVGAAITGGLKSFVNSRSDLEGVEMPQKNKKQKIQFDPDAFTDAVNKILDFRIPNSDDDASSSSMSGYSDEEDEDVALNEEPEGPSVEARDMRQYLEEMDRELSKTNIGLSFERLPPRATADSEEEASDINEESDEFRAVDVDLTALKNILESYSSQEGMPGPASNLFTSLGVNLPHNLDI